MNIFIFSVSLLQYETEKWVKITDTEKSKRQLQNRMRVLRKQRRDHMFHREQIHNAQREHDHLNTSHSPKHQSPTQRLFITERTKTMTDLSMKNKQNTNLKVSTVTAETPHEANTNNSIRYHKFEVVDTPRFFISQPNLDHISSIRRPKRADTMQEETANRFLMRAMTDLEMVRLKNRKEEIEHARMISEMESKMGVKLKTPRRKKPIKKVLTLSSESLESRPQTGEVIIGLYPERMKDEYGMQPHDQLPSSSIPTFSQSVPSMSKLSQPIASSENLLLLSEDGTFSPKRGTAPTDVIREEDDLRIHEEVVHPQRDRKLTRKISKQTLEFPEISLEQQRKALGGTPRGESASSTRLVTMATKSGKGQRKLPDISRSKEELLNRDDSTGKNVRCVSLPKVNIFMEVVENPFDSGDLGQVTRSRDLIETKRNEAMHEWLGLESQQLEQMKRKAGKDDEQMEEGTGNDIADRLSDVSSGESDESNDGDDEDERFQVFKEKVIKRGKKITSKQEGLEKLHKTSDNVTNVDTDTPLMRAERERRKFIKNRLCSVLKAVLTVSYFWMIPPGDRVMSKTITAQRNDLDKQPAVVSAKNERNKAIC